MKKQIGLMMMFAMLAAAFLSGSVACAEVVSFDLIPSDGQVSGPAGSTVGWGYSITNQSAINWLVTAGLIADSFAFGTPLAIFDFPDLAPGTTASLPFDAVAGTGFYQLTWDAAAPAGFANFGRFTLSAEWWDSDPFNGGSFVESASDTVRTYFATVSEPTDVAPEPSTLPLGCLALVAVAARFRGLGRR